MYKFIRISFLYKCLEDMSFLVWLPLALSISPWGLSPVNAFSLNYQIRSCCSKRASDEKMMLLTAHTLNALDENDEDDSPSATSFPMEKDGPKDQILKLIQTANNKNDNDAMGFGSNISDSDRSKISALSDDLKGYALPVTVPSQWILLYNDAPDILGLKGGPLSDLVSIQQNYQSISELNVVLEYKPSDGVRSLTGNFLKDVEQDRLKQTIAFQYTKQPMNKIDLKLTGTNIEASRFGVFPMLSTPTSLPFVGFNILFNDDDLCIQQTVQGNFLFIYQKL